MVIRESDYPARTLFLTAMLISSLFQVEAAIADHHSISSPRRLLQLIGRSSGSHTVVTGRECSKRDIAIFQAQMAPQPNGIPTYAVEILNTGECSISDIHVACGWFASAELIVPQKFRRIAYNDCLVNGGRPLAAGRLVSFDYANTYSYPMSVSSISCSCL